MDVVTVRQALAASIMAEMAESYVPLSESTLQEMERSSTDAATRAVNEACAILRASHISCDSAILDGRPVEAIVEYAKTHSSDLVVMGSRGYGLIAGWALGSVSLGVLAHAACPVLVVPGRHH